MAEENPETEAPQSIAIAASWSDSSPLDQIFVDEMALQSVRGSFYLTFGQVRMPLVNTPDARAEIKPMVRLIVSGESLQRMVAVLRRSAPASADK